VGNPAHFVCAYAVDRLALFMLLQCRRCGLFDLRCAHDDASPSIIHEKTYGHLAVSRLSRGCAFGAPGAKKRIVLKLAFPVPAMEVQRMIESRQSYLEAGNMAMRSPRKDPTQKSLPIGIATVPDAKDSVFG